MFAHIDLSMLVSVIDNQFHAQMVGPKPTVHYD